MNFPEFAWIYLNLPEFTWIYFNLPQFTWIYLNLPEFTWIYLNLPEFTWIYLNLPEFTWVYLSLSEFIWIYLKLHKFTWIYLSLPVFTWIYLNLPEFTWIYLNGFTWVHLGSLGFTSVNLGWHGSHWRLWNIHTDIWTFLLYIEILSDLIMMKKSCFQVLTWKLDLFIKIPCSIPRVFEVHALKRKLLKKATFKNRCSKNTKNKTYWYINIFTSIFWEGVGAELLKINIYFTFV